MQSCHPLQTPFIASPRCDAAVCDHCGHLKSPCRVGWPPLPPPATAASAAPDLLLVTAIVPRCCSTLHPRNSHYTTAGAADTEGDWSAARPALATCCACRSLCPPPRRGRLPWPRAYTCCASRPACLRQALLRSGQGVASHELWAAGVRWHGAGVTSKPAPGPGVPHQRCPAAFRKPSCALSLCSAASGASSGNWRRLHQAALAGTVRAVLPAPKSCPGDLWPSSSSSPSSSSCSVLQDEVAQMVDGIWSLQYLAAGPICGSAGPLKGFRSAGGSGTGDGAAAQPASHAVLFRYANEAALARFESQPRVQLMLGGTGAPAGTGAAPASAGPCALAAMSPGGTAGPESSRTRRMHRAQAAPVEGTRDSLSVGCQQFVPRTESPPSLPPPNPTPPTHPPQLPPVCRHHHHQFPGQRAERAGGHFPAGARVGGGVGAGGSAGAAGGAQHARHVVPPE